MIGVVPGILSGNLAAYFLESPTVLPFGWVVYGLLRRSVVGVVFWIYARHPGSEPRPD